MKWKDLESNDKFDFKEQIAKLVFEVKRNIKSNEIDGKIFSGRMIMNLVLELVSLFNEKEIPVLLDCVNNVVKSE